MPFHTVRTRNVAEWGAHGANSWRVTAWLAGQMPHVPECMELTERHAVMDPCIETCMLSGSRAFSAACMRVTQTWTRVSSGGGAPTLKRTRRPHSPPASSRVSRSRRPASLHRLRGVRLIRLSPAQRPLAPAPALVPGPALQGWGDQAGGRRGAHRPATSACRWITSRGLCRRGGGGAGGAAGCLGR